MRKLLLVIFLLVIVLLVSWWAKSVNFSPLAMLHTLPEVKGTATNVATNTPTIPTPVPVEIIITITPNGFVPDVLMIDRNTKITWINKSGTTTNISSDPINTYTSLNLGDFGENGSVSLNFSEKGRYHYINSKNPLQKGTLVVR